MLVKIGDELFHADSLKIKSVESFFRKSGVWELDVSKLDGNLYEISEKIARAVGADADLIRNAIKKAIRMHEKEKDEKLRNELKNLLEGGVFAVAPTTDNVENNLFTRRGNLYYLDKDKLTEAILKNKIKDEKRLVWFVKRAMDSANLKYYDFHIDWLKSNAGNIIKKAIENYYNRNTIVMLDTGEDIELVFGRKLTSEELVVLREAFTTKYYVQDSHGNLTEHRLRVIKYDRERRRYRIPYFAVPHLMKVAKKLGFKRIVNKVDWVKREIPSPPKVDVKLYRFQAQALNAWLDGGCRGVVVVPTGGGKTYIGLVALAYLSVPALVCVTTIELARQWIQKIKEHLGVEDVGLLGGGKHDIKDITVAIYNSAVKHIDKLKDRFDLFIADESHHIPAKVFKEIAFKLKARKRLALSATPYRLDRNEALLFFTMGGIVYKAKYEEMVRLRLASPLKYYRVYVRLSPEESMLYSQANGLPNTNPARIQKLMKIAFNAKEKYEVLKKIIQKLPEDKVLVFCQYVEQARKAYRAIRDIAGGQVALFTGSTKSELRKKYFEQFKEGRKRIIVTTTVLDEGIDVPDAETAIIMSGSGTERQMIQRIGRVIRYRPNKVAKVIEIITRNTIEEKIAERRAKVLREYGIKI